MVAMVPVVLSVPEKMVPTVPVTGLLLKHRVTAERYSQYPQRFS